MNNRCVCCGEIIPEGRQVCPNCEKKPMDIFEKLVELIYKAEKQANKRCDFAENCDKCPANNQKIDCMDWLKTDCLLSLGVTVQKWISVKDRLPEKGQIVLACGKRHATSGMFQGASRNNPKMWHWKGNTLKEVTHWMPLPQPPKGE